MSDEDKPKLAVFAFKKREGRNIRKRLREDEEEEQDVPKAEEEQPEDNRPLSEKLADARLAQQLRQRKAGLDHNKLALGAREDEDQVVEEVNLGTGLNDAFENRGKQQQNYGLQDRREDEEDPHLREFLEQRLAEKKRAQELGAGKERDPFARGPGEAGGRAEENMDAVLFHVPEHLMGMQKRDLNSEAAGWLTGIQEVRLDKKFKMKNVEETELAKKKILEDAAKGPGEDDGDRLPKMHTRLWMMPRQFGRGAQYKGQSDTAVARRFKENAFSKDTKKK